MTQPGACTACRALMAHPYDRAPHANLVSDAVSRITLSDAHLDLYDCLVCGARFRYRRARLAGAIEWVCFGFRRPASRCPPGTAFGVAPLPPSP
jgi:hypothetical protein